MNERARKFIESNPSTNFVKIAAFRSLRSSLLADCGDYLLAAVEDRKIIEQLKLNHGPRHPSVATALNNLAYSLYFSEQFAEALEACEECLSIMKEAERTPPSHLRSQYRWKHLSELRLERYDSVLETVESWLELLDREPASEDKRIEHYWAQAARLEALFELEQDKEVIALAADWPNDLDTFHVWRKDCIAGAAHCRQGNFETGLPLMLTGFEKLRSNVDLIPTNMLFVIGAAGERIRDHYVEVNDAEAVQKWEASLAELDIELKAAARKQLAWQRSETTSK